MAAPFAFGLVMTDRDFRLFTPVTIFEKADAPQGKRRRIAGLVTSEGRDRQGEIILQRGLDFSEFLSAGWYNDNHRKDAAGVVGCPESVRFVRKGEHLPDGRRAPSDGHWAEGYMLEGHKAADDLWQLATAVQKSGTNRTLGFSIEGVIERRADLDQKTITKAKVRNVAITHCPVNTDTAMMALEKSLGELEKAITELEEETTDKALTIGTATPGVKPTGPVTGAGAGQVLARQSLDTDEPKKLTKSMMTVRVRERFPEISKQAAERAVDLILSAHAKNLL